MRRFPRPVEKEMIKMTFEEETIEIKFPLGIAEETIEIRFTSGIKKGQIEMKFAWRIDGKMMNIKCVSDALR